MRLRGFSEMHDFYAHVEPYLLAREAEHSLILGISNGILADPTTYDDVYMACVEDDEGAIIAVLLRTVPLNLIVSHINVNDAAGVVDFIAREVNKTYPTLPGVLGTRPFPEQFAAAWQAQTGQPYQLAMAQRIYALRQIKPVTGVSGTMRPAAESDRELLINWMMGFYVDALESITREDAEKSIDGFLKKGVRQIFIWEDDPDGKGVRPVSMAARTGPTPTGSRVGFVYTPPGYRRRGYASAVTAALSQHLLDSGRQMCVLYTDLANPTSNHIYMEIGYKPICDSDMYHFEGQA